MENKSQNVALIILAMLLISLIAILGSCNAQKKLQKSEAKANAQIEKIKAKHPNVLLNQCTTTYPSKDSTHIEYKYIQGSVITTQTTKKQFYFNIMSILLGQLALKLIIRLFIPKLQFLLKYLI